MISRLLSLFCIVLFTFSSLLSVEAVAAKKERKAAKSTNKRVQATLVVDGRSGKILHARNSKKIIYPASLTKVMTLYMVFEALESGKISINQTFKVSKHASQAVPLKLYLKPGEKIKVKDLIPALIIKSANDAARVIAEGLGGTEQKFARLMTIRARQLGMKNTTFTNASGLPDKRQRTTAVDLAKLAIAIRRDFPQYYHFFSKTSFRYKNKILKGHNRITASYPGAEGLKTGYINAAGCNIISTATRGRKSLVTVVIGGQSAASRDKTVRSLFDKHFGISNVSSSKNKTKSKRRSR